MDVNELAKQMSLSCLGDVITLQVGESAMKVKVPKGERGVSGRDGISIRGEKGEKGDVGLPGRDSLVPGEKGEKGEKGDTGIPGRTPEISVGSVVVGETAAVVVSGSVEKPVLNFVIPRGERGFAGLPGAKGKDGTHEYIQVHYAGHMPRFTNEWISAYVICDGIVDLPEMTEEDIGKWTHIKTFDRVCVNGLVETQSVLDKEGAKFVVMSYNGKFLFTRF